MWKHNNTVDWFCNCKLSAQKQTTILEAARKNCGKLQQKSKEYEAEERAKIKNKMKENKRKRDEKDIKEKQKRCDLLGIILSHGGLCKTKGELDLLVSSGNVESLRDQIRFRNLFLEQKNLRVTGNFKELYDSLLDQILQDSGECSSHEKRIKIVDEDSDF